jgi:hypothetical protein
MAFYIPKKRWDRFSSLFGNNPASTRPTWMLYSAADALIKLLEGERPSEKQTEMILLLATALKPSLARTEALAADQYVVPTSVFWPTESQFGNVFKLTVTDVQERILNADPFITSKAAKAAAVEAVKILREKGLEVADA